MTITQKAQATARRNLSQRIDNYLLALEKREAQPRRREGDHLLRALGHWQTGAFADGERDMMWADWASHQPDATDPHPSASTQDLRHRFAAISAAVAVE
jgi:hypothetical protein